MTEDYIGITTNIPYIGHGTQLIDPADLDPMKPCVVRRLDEDYWRGILRKHFPYVVTDAGPPILQSADCECGLDIDYMPMGEAVNAWIDHVLKVAATTPEAIDGAPIPDGVPSTLLVQE